MDINIDSCWSERNLGKFGENSELETPFEFHIYPDLLDVASVSKLREDIKSVIKLERKDNDLYKFRQSKDINCEVSANNITPTIKQFIEILQGRLREHLEKSTGIKLSKKYFDITVSRYDTGDYLLCHNDDIKNEDKNHRRALAFIYYLNTRPWTCGDGGALIIYKSDAAGEPIEIANRIWPQPNSLVVFKTSATSWHSVEEVYSQDDIRLSINGWFHTEDPIVQSLIEVVPETSLFTIHRPLTLNPKLERFFEEYVNGEYLTEKTCYVIRKKFKRQSEINLVNFLVKERYLEISQALKQAAENDSNSIHLKPYNKRNYRRMAVDELPEVCRDLYDAFRSELFFLFLWRVTGLELQPPGWKREDTKMNDTSEDESGSESSEASEECELEESDDEGQDEHEKLSDEEKSNEQESEKLTLESTHDCKTPNESKTDELEPEGSCDRRVEESKDVNIFKKIAPEQSTNESKSKKQRLSGPLMRAEYRHLKHGSYTMIHDHDFELSEASGLDVILHFNHDFDVDLEHGGYIDYIDAGNGMDVHDAEQELLSIEPKSNCLSIVYRGDVETCRFLKYINKFHKSDYQELSCVYYEKQEDLAYGGVGANFDGHLSG